MSHLGIAALLREYRSALDYTDALWVDLTDDEVRWRPHEQSSAIGWHLGHQAAVAHYLMRNLTAAEPSVDPDLDALMDSATPEPDRGDLPDLDRLRRYRNEIATRLVAGMERIDRGDVGAPAQLRPIAEGVLRAVVNHEYQHDQWIGEVRTRDLGKRLPARPQSDRLTTLDGYVVLA